MSVDRLNVIKTEDPSVSRYRVSRNPLYRHSSRNLVGQSNDEGDINAYFGPFRPTFKKNGDGTFSRTEHRLFPEATPPKEIVFSDNGHEPREVLQADNSGVIYTAVGLPEGPVPTS